MTIIVSDFRRFVVEPTCELCQNLAAVPDSQFVQDLIVATAAQETSIGRYLHQGGQGDAISIYQFEPATLRILLSDYVLGAKNRDGSPRYTNLLRATRFGADTDPCVEIMTNLSFATVMARLYYYREPEAFPPGATTFLNLWHWYKTYWNTELGSATEQSFANALKAYTDLPHTY